MRRYWSDFGCSVACSKLGRVKSGKRAGTLCELPDYEAGALLGTNFGIFDINEMAVTTARPDDLGLDLISACDVAGGPVRRRIGAFSAQPISAACS